MFRNRIADVTKNLLILNIAIWVLGLVLVPLGTNPNDHLGLYYFQSENFRPWQIITSMFSHALYVGDRIYFIHILFNMFMLWMFGSHVERILGKKRYFLLYLVSGFGASFFHQLMIFLGIVEYESVAQLMNSNLVGASGAIFGVLAGFAYIFPNARLMLLIPPIPVKAKILIPILLGLELFFGLGNISDNIAHFAHIGGAIFGLIFLIVWRIKPNQYYS